MPGWIGPTVAVALVVIALSYVAIGFLLVFAAREAAERSKAFARDLAELRADLAPTLNAVRRLGEKGFEVVEMAESEAREIVATTQRLRHDVQRGVDRAKRRLADFEATVEVVQEEIDATVVQLGTALETARTGAGMIGQLRRLIRPRRRGSR